MNKESKQKAAIKNNEKKFQEWLEQKESNAVTGNEVSKEIREHAENIVEIRNLHKELKETHEKYDAHISWLRSNSLPIDVMQPLRNEIVEKKRKLRQIQQKHDLTNKKNGIRLGESLGGLRGLIFSMETVKGRHFPHFTDQEIQGTFDQ